MMLRLSQDVVNVFAKMSGLSHNFKIVSGLWDCSNGTIFDCVDGSRMFDCLEIN